MFRRFARAALVSLTVLIGLWAQTARQADRLHIHVVCPDHGELIERVAHVDNHGARLVDADAAAGHDDGCLLAWATPVGGWVPPAPVAALQHPEAEPTPTVILTAAVGVSRPPLRDAPKTSPPRA